MFTVSIRKDIYKGYFFPAPIPLEKKLKDVLEDDVDEKYYLTDEQVARFKATTYNCSKLDTIVQNREGVSRTLCARDYKDPKCIEVVGRVEAINGHDILKRVYGTDGVAPTLSTMGGGNTEPKIVTGGGVQIVDDIYKNRPPRFYGKTAPTIRANHAGDLKVAKIYPNKK